MTRRRPQETLEGERGLSYRPSWAVLSLEAEASSKGEAAAPGTRASNGLRPGVAAVGSQWYNALSRSPGLCPGLGLGAVGVYDASRARRTSRQLCKNCLSVAAPWVW